MLYYNYKRENKERTEPKMMTEREEYIWSKLVELDIATDDEILLVTKILNSSEKTLNSILYVRTGYRDLEQMFNEE